MKITPTTPMSEDSDTDDDTSNTGTYTDVEFRFMLKDTNTIFQGLSHALN